MNFKKLTLAVIVSLSIASCEKDDPEDIHEHEVFSNVILTLTPEEGGDEVEFHWHDVNGNLITEDEEKENGSLSAGTTYNAVISFNEEEEHEEDDHDHDHEEEEHDLDAEILKEAEEHQIFFSTVTGLTIIYNDKDGNGNPLGLETIFETDETYTGGDLKITLRHEPNKDAEGVSDGDITYAGGESDIEITFTLGAE